MFPRRRSLRKRLREGSQWGPQIGRLQVGVLLPRASSEVSPPWTWAARLGSEGRLLWHPLPSKLEGWLILDAAGLGDRRTGQMNPPELDVALLVRGSKDGPKCLPGSAYGPVGHLRVR